MITAKDIFKKHTLFDGWLVSSLTETDDFFWIGAIAKDSVSLLIGGPPTIAVDKASGEFIYFFPDLKNSEYLSFEKDLRIPFESTNGSIIINPEREKYRAHLNEMSMKEYGRPYRFPDEEEDEEGFADGDD